MPLPTATASFPEKLGQAKILLPYFRSKIELSDIGESTRDCIMETCYPELRKGIATAEWDEAGIGYSAKGNEQIREAVECERTRLWGCQPVGSKNSCGVAVILQ
jgi:hypothetical protein